jgi:hypothetical protein
MAVRRRGVGREQIDAPNVLMSADGSYGATSTFANNSCGFLSNSSTLPKADLVKRPLAGSLKI